MALLICKILRSFIIQVNSNPVFWCNRPFIYFICTNYSHCNISGSFQTGRRNAVYDVGVETRKYRATFSVSGACSSCVRGRQEGPGGGERTRRRRRRRRQVEERGSCQPGVERGRSPALRRRIFRQRSRPAGEFNRRSGRREEKDDSTGV